MSQLHPIRHEEMNKVLKLMHKKADANEAVDMGGELAKLTNTCHIENDYEPKVF